MSLLVVGSTQQLLGAGASGRPGRAGASSSGLTNVGKLGQSGGGREDFLAYFPVLALGPSDGVFFSRRNVMILTRGFSLYTTKQFSSTAGSLTF